MLDGGVIYVGMFIVPNAVTEIRTYDHKYQHHLNGKQPILTKYFYYLQLW